MSDQAAGQGQRPEDDPGFAERIKTIVSYADLAAVDEMRVVDPAEKKKDDASQTRSGAGSRLGLFGLSVVAGVLLILIVFLAATRGVDPTQWLQSPPEKPVVTQPAAGDGAQTQQAVTSEAHDEEAPDHVAQGWTPTQVDAGEWQVAVAREDPLVQTWSDIGGEPKEGNRAVLVDVYVTNNGAEDRIIDKSFFSLTDGTGTDYPILGLEPQGASPGNPVYLETWYEVPVDTQGLSLHFAPPGTLGGQPVDIALPEIRY